jgi:hypothetical protein
MLWTTLFHVPRDSVTAPDATLSGIFSCSISRAGDGVELTGAAVVGADAADPLAFSAVPGD